MPVAPAAGRALLGFRESSEAAEQETVRDALGTDSASEWKFPHGCAELRWPKGMCEHRSAHHQTFISL